MGERVGMERKMVCGACIALAFGLFGWEKKSVQRYHRENEEDQEQSSRLIFCGRSEEVIPAEDRYVCYLRASN